jgi:hypothetical protein
MTVTHVKADEPELRGVGAVGAAAASAYNSEYMRPCENRRKIEPNCATVSTYPSFWMRSKPDGPTAIPPMTYLKTRREG